MKVLTVRNVAAALSEGLQLIHSYGEKEPSRAGPVIVVPWPVTTVYLRPRQRVLFSAVRDANPFFHLMEALWMLAGRRDSAFLDQFVRDFGSRFAEPDGTVHDAYGYRWGHAFGFDQLEAIIGQLTAQPASRQAVLQLWDCWGCDDLRGQWKTRPCNTHVYFRVQDVGKPCLDMTVCCRSNDIIWGAYGSNAVHFSILQEYMAARLDVGVGIYYQISNNFHVYESELSRLSARMVSRGMQLWDAVNDQRYVTGSINPTSLVHEPGVFDDELRSLLFNYENGDFLGYAEAELANEFLGKTVAPMLEVHRVYRQEGARSALDVVERIHATDWCIACREWLQRRVAKDVA